MAGASDPSHDQLCAARCNPYHKLSEEAVAAGEVRWGVDDGEGREVLAGRTRQGAGSEEATDHGG